MTNGDDPAAAMKLQVDFRNWSIWRSKHRSGKLGDWWATRRRVLSDDEMTSGLAHTLTADTADDLRTALVAQRRLERACRRELAARS